MYKVSVIIPVYNAEQYLSKCLDSVCNQTLKDIEIICIDDCSTDGSLSILKQFQRLDKRIKVIKPDKNSGVSVARNIGIKQAYGRYFSFIDADDFLETDMLEKLYTKAKETGADIVIGRLVEIGYDSTEVQRTEVELVTKYKDKFFAAAAFTPAIYSSELITKNNIKFPEGVILGEDILFLAKAVIAANIVEAVPDAKYFYVRHSDSGNSRILSKHKIDSALPALNEIARLYKSCEPGPGRDFAYKNILDILWMFALKTDINETKRCLAAFYEIYDGYPQKELLNIFPALRQISCLNTEARINKTLFLINAFKSKEIKKEWKDHPPITKEKLLELYRQYDYLNGTNNNPLIKIFVSYIKPSFLFKTNILTPIHLGRAVERESSKDGKITEEGIQWLHNNCIGDNACKDNISEVNRRVGFLTGTYYAWKNYNKIGNPQYLGSFGYRRLLNPSFLDTLTSFDMVIPKPRNLYPETVKEQFVRIHGGETYYNMLEIFNKIYLEELPELIKYFEQSSGYFDEIYIMKKNLFFDFCEWVFPLLFEYLKLTPVSTSVETRDIAFITERLTGYYLFKLRNEKSLKYYEADVVVTQKQSVNKNIITGDLIAKLKNKIKETV